MLVLLQTIGVVLALAALAVMAITPILLDLHETTPSRHGERATTSGRDAALPERNTGPRSAQSGSAHAGRITAPGAAA